MARIAGINIPQNKLVQVGLTYIYGIGDKFSKQICTSLAIPKEKRVNQLTDDEIINKIIKNIIFDPKKTNKLIFDGYPRSLTQAKNLDIMLNDTNQKIDFIFFLNVEKNTIIKRIEKRKILEKRSDDNIETILKRYDTYMDTTKPVLDFYSKNQNFYEIDGSLKIEEITAKIDAFLNV